MTLLLIDIGNTRVKWARLVDGKMSKQQASANAGWTAADYARRVIGRGLAKPVIAAAVPPAPICWFGAPAQRSTRSGPPAPSVSQLMRHAATPDRIVVSSVAGDEVNRALTEAAAQSRRPNPRVCHLRTQRRRHHHRLHRPLASRC